MSASMWSKYNISSVYTICRASTLYTHRYDASQYCVVIGFFLLLKDKLPHICIIKSLNPCCLLQNCDTLWASPHILLSTLFDQLANLIRSVSCLFFFFFIILVWQRRIVRRHRVDRVCCCRYVSLLSSPLSPVCSVVWMLWYTQHFDFLSSSKSIDYHYTCMLRILCK